MIIQTLKQLQSIYAAAPAPAAVVKEVEWLTPEYRRLIEVSPFVALATCGPEGLDCSPRGDEPGFVRVADSQTLIMPDRRGNNRIASLRNIVSDPRVALLFLIPGSGTTFRVNGRAAISVDPDLLASFAVGAATPRTALVIKVEAAYFQCARAIMRSNLWDASRYVDTGGLPTPGAMLAALSCGTVGGKTYDEEWPSRALDSLW